MFGGRVFQYITGIPICTNCALPSYRLVPLLVQDRLHTGASQEKRKEASPIL